MMDGYAKCSDLKTAAVVPAVDKDDDDAAGVLLVATPVAATSTERVEVIAPESLPGGYELSCDFCGRSVVVRVVRGIAFRGSRGSSPFLNGFDSTTIAIADSYPCFFDSYASRPKESRRDSSSWRT
jgi:hypothetical protein